MTNFDKIKNMNVKEMAEFFQDDIVKIAIDNVCTATCRHVDALGRCTVVDSEGCLMSDVAVIKLWLESEADNDISKN